MPIHIEAINAKGLGPLDEFVHKLGKFNLIYGRNEQGKTFLVEFILKSLFKNVKVFNLRDVTPTGSVIISGLEPKACEFSPSSWKKIEDYWEDNLPGMPTNIAQLLVVKGADLSFIEDIPSGVSKKVVKSFLSSERTLDLIQGKIQLTVQEAEIENGEIIGANRGELGNRNKIKKELEQIENILNKVNHDYSVGKLTALLAEEDLLKEEIANQEKAKHFQAYTLWEKIQKIEKDIRSLEESGIHNLVELNQELNRKTGELQDKRKKQEKAKEGSKHYEWINSAVEEYEKYLKQGVESSKHLTLILSTALFSGAALFTIIGLSLNLLDLTPIGTITFCIIGILIILGMLFSFLFYRRQQKRENTLVQSQELRRIAKEYQKRINKPLTDVVTIKSQQQSMQKDYYESKTLDKEVNDLVSEINLLKSRIINMFEKLGIRCGDESEWNKLIDQQEETLAKYKNQIQEIQITLSNLDVDSSEYLMSDPEINYDKSEMTIALNELQDIQNQNKKEEQKIELLKTEIHTAISDQSTTSWERLLEQLSHYRNQLLTTYENTTFRILAGIIVTQVIHEARQQEDEKLKIMLNSPIVKKPLYEITKKYKEVRIDGEKLRVSDKFEEFDIADLSTATKEQVLLALRLGFASKVMGQETAFLVLDDAFQHSDWRRREFLLDTIIALAKSGWQIVYFSMDDHIRDLFNELGKKIFKEDYFYYEL